MSAPDSGDDGGSNGSNGAPAAATVAAAAAAAAAGAEHDRAAQVEVQRQLELVQHEANDMRRVAAGYRMQLLQRNDELAAAVGRAADLDDLAAGLERQVRHQAEAAAVTAAAATRLPPVPAAWGRDGDGGSARSGSGGSGRDSSGCGRCSGLCGGAWAQQHDDGGRARPQLYAEGELAAACSGFDESAIIGRGSFGPVYRGKFSGGDVAVKRLEPAPNEHGGAGAVAAAAGRGVVAMPHFLREIDVLTVCRHKNLVQLLGICVGPSPCLVYRFAGRSLAWHLATAGRRLQLSGTARLRVALDVARGVLCLHTPRFGPRTGPAGEHGGGGCGSGGGGGGGEGRGGEEGAAGRPAFVHRDIKPDNILLDGRLRARLADMGAAMPVPLPPGEAAIAAAGITAATLPVVGTLGYLDPELTRSGRSSGSGREIRGGNENGSDGYGGNVSPGPQTFKSDIYSLGVVLLQLLTGLPAHDPQRTPPDLVTRVRGFRLSDVLDAAGAWDEEKAVALAAIAWECCALRSALRPDIAAVVSRLAALLPDDEAAATGAAAARAGLVAAGAAAGAADGGAQRRRRRECMLCASAAVRTRFMPCMHSVACETCATLLIRSVSPLCPMDRARIAGVEVGHFEQTYTHVI
ncbi:unnamed protein product [Phaeothamnion confervicola]